MVMMMHSVQKLCHIRFSQFKSVSLIALNAQGLLVELSDSFILVFKLISFKNDCNLLFLQMSKLHLNVIFD
ncbi:hypothetical protein SHPE106448_18885 [Shewanella pealeana]